MWLNDRHLNTKPPKGVMGGSMCTCKDNKNCLKERKRLWGKAKRLIMVVGKEK
jgi:hypothetical protein